MVYQHALAMQPQRTHIQNYHPYEDEEEEEVTPLWFRKQTKKRPMKSQSRNLDQHEQSQEGGEAQTEELNLAST